MYLYKEKNQGWAPDVGPKQLKGSTLGCSDVGKAQKFSSEYARLWDVQGGGRQMSLEVSRWVSRKYKLESCQNESVIKATVCLVKEQK